MTVLYLTVGWRRGVGAAAKLTGRAGGLHEELSSGSTTAERGENESREFGLGPVCTMPVYPATVA